MCIELDYTKLFHKAWNISQSHMDPFDNTYMVLFPLILKPDSLSPSESHSYGKEWAGHSSKIHLLCSTE